MLWLFLGVVLVVFILAVVFAFLLWQKWTAPWRQIEHLVRQISRGERPRTFLVEGGKRTRRISLALENLFARQQERDQQMAQRESGTKTILSAMHDGLLVVDAGARVVLANETFRQLFSPREVILRIRAILRRGAAETTDEELAAGPITIDPARHAVSVEGKRVNLTSLEFKLLRTLMQRRGRVQARDRLLNDVWGYESVIDTRTVDTHVRRLREKLGNAGEIIETVRGFGYRLREE